MILDDFNLETAIYLVKKYNAIILDTRTVKEFCKGHLCRATFVKVNSNPTRNEIYKLRNKLEYMFRKIHYNYPIIVYCRVGNRSRTIRHILESLGFNYVFVLGGVDVNPLKQVFEDNHNFFKVCYCTK